MHEAAAVAGLFADRRERGAAVAALADQAQRGRQHPPIGLGDPLVLRAARQVVVVVGDEAQVKAELEPFGEAKVVTP